jgi:nucleotide-binding universal stress UspA family protein
MSAQTPLKILVPTDFSESARAALDWALEHASRMPSELHLLHVVEYHLSDVVNSVAVDDNRLRDLSQQAQHALHTLCPEGATEPRLTRHVAVGRAGAEILRVAAKLDVGLIVIGGHGKDKMPELLTGSTTDKVVRLARCPVVCVKH